LSSNQDGNWWRWSCNRLISAVYNDKSEVWIYRLQAVLLIDRIMFTESIITILDLNVSLDYTDTWSPYGSVTRSGWIRSIVWVTWNKLTGLVDPVCWWRFYEPLSHSSSVSHRSWMIFLTFGSVFISFSFWCAICHLYFSVLVDAGISCLSDADVKIMKHILIQTEWVIFFKC